MHAVASQTRSGTQEENERLTSDASKMGRNERTRERGNEGNDREIISIVSAGDEQ